MSQKLTIRTDGGGFVLKIDAEKFKKFWSAFDEAKEPPTVEFITQENDRIAFAGEYKTKEHKIIIYPQNFGTYKKGGQAVYFLGEFFLVFTHEVSHALLYTESFAFFRAKIHNACQKILETVAKNIKVFDNLPILFLNTTVWMTKKLIKIREAVTESLAKELRDEYGELLKMINISETNKIEPPR